jgi:transcriptional regulator with XRE-family HTH domain
LACKIFFERYIEKMTTGELIALSRDLKGWSLRELERRSGVTYQTISLIETGKTAHSSFLTIVKLARALNLSLDRLAETVEQDPAAD